MPPKRKLIHTLSQENRIQSAEKGFPALFDEIKTLFVDNSKYSAYDEFIQNVKNEYPVVFNAETIKEQIVSQHEEAKKRKLEKRQDPDFLRQKKEKVTFTLLGSIQERQFYTDGNIYSSPQSHNGDIQVIGGKLQEYFRVEDHLKNNLLYNRIIVGEYLSYLKSLFSDNFVETVNNFITMSKSEIYFTISLFEIASQYHILKRSNLSIRYVKTEWKTIKTILSEDNRFH